jgi:hypothetical protein
MHPLHDYVAEKLAEKLRAKKLVVWYDLRSEFAPFVATQLAEYDGSMFELRANGRATALLCSTRWRRG